MNGHEKLNLAFVANLFNNHPGLEPPSPEQVVNVIEETREEKMFRYSVGANSQILLNSEYMYLVLESMSNTE